MNLLQAIFLGIVQGLTEFLPVSSSGHLAILKNIFKMNTDTGILYDILLHVATLISVCLVMSRDVLRLFFEGIAIIVDLVGNLKIYINNKTGKGNGDEYAPIITNSYRKFAIMVIVSTIPTAFLGFLLKDIIETVETELLVPGICLLATGGILLMTDYISDKGKKPKDATMLDALAVGAAQGVATLPGLSRSGTTIAACILCGMERRFAVKYSFIMSIPAILGALLLEIKDIGEDGVKAAEIPLYIVGMIVAAVVGFIALKFMVQLVTNNKFKYFAYYCLAIGVLSIIGYIILL